MRLLALAVATISAPLFAHPGHGATPAHTHVDGVPLDVGAFVVVVVVGVVALAVAKKKRDARR